MFYVLLRLLDEWLTTGRLPREELRLSWRRIGLTLLIIWGTLIAAVLVFRVVYELAS